MVRTSEYPAGSELVVCTVKNVKNFGAFVTLDEFGDKEGFIHVRDVATGWVKYIRDHIREGQKVVCKVLGVDASRGHIDLSLKHVNEHQRREKIQEWKNEKKADKLLEIAGTALGKTMDQAVKEVGTKLLGEFGTLYAAFETAAADPAALKDLGLDKRWIAELTRVASDNIQEAKVQIDGILELTSTKPDGVVHIRKALMAAAQNEAAETNVLVQYVGAPRYRISVSAADYKTAEEILRRAVERAQQSIEQSQGTWKFERSE